MVRIGKDGETLSVTDYNDDNYFRLNIWGMGRARNLALWGYGIMSATELLEEEMRIHAVFYSERVFESEKMVQTLLEAQVDLVEKTKSMLEHSSADGFAAQYSNVHDSSQDA